MSYVTAEEIKKVYEELKNVTIRHSNAMMNEIAAKTELEKLKAQALSDGTITEIVGQRSNAETREAALRELFAEQYQSLEDVQTLVQGVRLALDLSRINVEEVKMLMRLSELETNVDNKS